MTRSNDTAPRTYSIRDLTREYAITARTLRHYEDEGLISPVRDGQTRIYSAADRVRLAWILRGRRVGFSLAEIGEMLALYETSNGRERQRKVALSKCQRRIKDLEAQRRDIDATIDELSQFCDSLERVTFDETSGRWIDSATGLDPEPITPFLIEDGTPSTLPR